MTHKLSLSQQEFMVGRLAMMMQGFGNDVHIITSLLESDSRRREELSVWRLPALDLSFLTKGTTYPFVPYRLLKKALKEIAPDIIHVQSHLFLTSYGSVRAAAGLAIPSVVTVHGLSVKRGTVLKGIQGAYLYTIGRDIFRKATVIHCLSKHEERRVLSIEPRANTVVIPNGVDTSEFSPAVEKKENMVVWVGRMVQEKGLEYLLRAVGMAMKERMDFRVVMVGDGPLLGYVQEFVRKNGYDKILRLTGHLSREGVARILAESSVFVMPSLSEGIPYSLLEAMSAENAVIVSSLPSIKEVIEDNNDGILVPPGNAKVIAEELLRCLADPQYTRNLAVKARRKVIHNYSLDKVVERLASLYESNLS